MEGKLTFLLWVQPNLCSKRRIPLHSYMISLLPDAGIYNFSSWKSAFDFGRKKYEMREPPACLVLSEAIFFSVHVLVFVEGRERKIQVDVKCRQPVSGSSLGLCSLVHHLWNALYIFSCCNKHTSMLMYLFYVQGSESRVTFAIYFGKVHAPSLEWKLEGIWRTVSFWGESSGRQEQGINPGTDSGFL